VSRRVRLILLLAAVLIVGYVIEEAVRTISILGRIEAERDGWQRPEAILDQLNLHPGGVVVDLGSGTGYFALKLAPIVGPSGRVLAVDLRRESLAFLWLRARGRGESWVQPIVGDPDNPRVPGGTIVDAVLIANTFHELSAVEAILAKLRAALRPGGRLVVVDRRPRTQSGAPGSPQHGIAPAASREQIEKSGFRLLNADDTFIDQPTGDDVWWMQVFDRP
jgi:predicted methyltransferase